MASAAGVRAGGAFIEIFAKDGPFQQAMGRVQTKLATVAQSLQRFGTGLSLGGAALGAPLVLAAKQAAGFEDALLSMKGAAGLGAIDVSNLEAEAKRLASTMGASPTTIAQAFLELAKAGMTVQDVLAGAGKSAVEFSKVGGVDAERAAVFMKAAMNVFGVSAEEAVDTLSAAADSSETSISAMVESFSQVGSAGKAFNQSLFGISQAMVALAKSNIIGEEAGTAIKTMLTKLVAPTQDAQEALGRLGLSVSDFRDEAGQLLPMQQIAAVFERALQKMGGSAEELMMSQQALVDVFEQRGIKVITAFANIGEQGFAKIAAEMQSALPVSQKFAITMEGISGQFQRLKTGVELISIAFGNAVTGPLKSTTDSLMGLMELVAKLIEQFPQLAVGISGVAASMVAIGAGSIAISLGLKAVKTAIAAVLALASPGGLIALLAIDMVLLAGEMTGAFDDLESLGMRLLSIWSKLGLWIRAAFDQNFFAMGLNAALKQVDADFAAWEANRKNKKEQRPEQAVTPDQNRVPMAENPLERRRLADELAKEEADAEQEMTRAITQQTNAYFDATKKAKDFGEAGKAASAQYFAGLAKLAGQLQAGILNTTSYTQAAEALGEQFSGQLDAMREAQQAKPDAGFGQTLGGFNASGGAGGIGIGPELDPVANATRQTAENTARAANALDSLVNEGRLLAGDDRAKAEQMRASLAADVSEMRKRASASALDFAAAGKSPTAGIDVAALTEAESKLAALDAFLGGSVQPAFASVASSASAAAVAMQEMAGVTQAASLQESQLAALNPLAAAAATATPVQPTVEAAAMAAQIGTEIAAGFTRLGEHMSRMTSTLSAAMDKNNSLTATSNSFLEKIAYRLEKAGAVFT